MSIASRDSYRVKRAELTFDMFDSCQLRLMRDLYEVVPAKDVVPGDLVCDLTIYLLEVQTDQLGYIGMLLDGDIVVRKRVKVI